MAGKGATLLELSVGVTLLILSLLMSAGLGIFQVTDSRIRVY